MEFADWQKWSGNEVSKFACTVCGLPQYGAAIQESLTGKDLADYLDAGMLLDGLQRAGVTERAHQKQLRAALLGLAFREPSDLQSEFQRKLTVMPPMQPNSPMGSPRRRFRKGGATSRDI
mmetsp:Transcript_21632/g.65017  ORF Transcript_21632/g.65017 Transcript_21632/m.65017 type:complete len:120 (+) Transcript_21632:67-426(+)